MRCFAIRTGEEFLKRYFPDTAEASTRSEVILAMAQEIHAGRATPTGGIFMDATKVPLEVIQKVIPHVYKTCLHRGIDITKVPLEVAPGSHTWLGGLEVDVDGKTRSTVCSPPARRRAASTAATASAARRCRARWSMAAAPDDGRRRW